MHANPICQLGKRMGKKNKGTALEVVLFSLMHGVLPTISCSTISDLLIY